MKQRGVALVVALVTLTILGGVAALMLARTLNEMRHSKDDTAIVQSLLLARGAANVGGALLATQVRNQLQAIVSATASSSNPWAYGSGSGSEPDPQSVAQDLAGVASRLQSQVDALVCNLQPSPSTGGGQATLRIYFTNKACGMNLPPKTNLPPGRLVRGSPRTSGSSYTQTYAVPFVLYAEGKIGPYQRNVVAQGEFRFTLGRGSFARYALFTNVHSLPNGTNVWFTSRTLFDGPVHTNQFFRFYRQPWFGGVVTSAGCTDPGDTSCEGSTNYGARFYGEGFVNDTAMSPDAQHPSYKNAWGTHAPQFTKGVDWRSSFIRLPINNTAQRQAAQNSGIYVNDDILNLKLFTAKVGDTTYQRINIKVCTVWTWWGDCLRTRIHKYRYRQDKILQQYDATLGRWVTVQKNGAPLHFNGVIFADGEIKSLHGPNRSDPDDPNTAGPALAPFAQITVAADDRIEITGDLKYSDRPCESYPTRDPDTGEVTPATCDNLDAQNVLGVYSQNGNVMISDQAPRNLNIDGVLMSARGVVQVENFRSVAPKGAVYLTGGIIEYYYGAFGTFDPSTGQNASGYSRRFTYDKRMLYGLAPPFFPTTQLDTVLGVTVYSFGQREQVY